MKSLMTMAAVAACALALTACGGGGDDSSTSPLSRADEGIWSNLNSGDQYGMQTVILSDGTYWSLYGYLNQNNIAFGPKGVLHGTANVSGSSVSGAYTGFTDGSVFNGTYSGTVSAQSNLNLTFNDPSGALISTLGNNFNMSYDSIYNQPASLSAIAGNYQGGECVTTLPFTGTNTTAGVNAVSDGVGIFIGMCNGINPDLAEIPVGQQPPPASSPPISMTISGANLTIGGYGNTATSATLTPHGTTVNVFDISLTTGTDVDIKPIGTIYKGILFQTSSGTLEIMATSDNSAYYYIGTKQN